MKVRKVSASEASVLRGAWLTPEMKVRLIAYRDWMSYIRQENPDRWRLRERNFSWEVWYDAQLRKAQGRKRG